MKRKRTCVPCDGKGGENLKTCSRCKGKGSIVQMIRLGPFVTESSETCPLCKGLGEII